MSVTATMATDMALETIQSLRIPRTKSICALSDLGAHGLYKRGLHIGVLQSLIKKWTRMFSQQQGFTQSEGLCGGFSDGPEHL